MDSVESQAVESDNDFAPDADDALGVEEDSDAIAAGEAPEPKEKKKAPSPPNQQNQPKKYKVKVDGEELEVDEKELIARYQNARASDKRYKDAAELRRQAEAAFQAMRDGDLSLLERIVPENVLTRYAEDLLTKYIDRESMSPEARRAYEAERKLQEKEARLKQFEEREEKTRTSQVQLSADQEVEKSIVEAMSSIKQEVKVRPRLVLRVVEQLQANHLASQEDPNVSPIDPATAAKKAAAGLKRDAHEYIQNLPDTELLKLLTPKQRAFIRRTDVDDAISQMPSGIRKAHGSGEARPRKNASYEDFFAEREKQFK